MSESLPERKPKELITIVGPCASGKSSLGERLRRQGYNVRTAAQEHSYVPSMWQMSNPDYLIYLDVGLDTLRRRRGSPRWSEHEWLAQQQRLAHARQHADLYIATDNLSLDQVEAEATAMLRTKAVQPKQHRPTLSAEPKSLHKPTRLRFETRVAVAEDAPAVADLLGLPVSEDLTHNRAVAVATDTPRASLYAEYNGELIGAISWRDMNTEGAVIVETPHLRANGYSPRAVLSRLIRSLPGLVDERATILRYVVSLNQLMGAEDRETKAMLDEFTAIGYQFVAHKLVMRKLHLATDEPAVVLLDEDDSRQRLKYEGRGYHLSDELDYYEMAAHPSGFSLEEYLRQTINLGAEAHPTSMMRRDKMTSTVERPAETQPYTPIRAYRGQELHTKGWLQEAPLRMLMNNLDPEVAERPEELIVYGGSGKAARNPAALHKIMQCLQELEADETLMVQSGKPVGVFKTHPDAPRVLIANSNLVPAWATREVFSRLEAEGLTMYGQMTAGSWIYIGTQGILQGTYETFAQASRQHYGGDLAGKLVLTAGLGGMGGAQPLAITMNGGVAIVVEVDPSRIQRRLDGRYLDTRADTLDAALALAKEAMGKGEPLSIGLLGNAAEIYPEFVKRGLKPDMVTDQTSAHDPLRGYIPIGYDVEQAAELRQRDPEEYVRRSMASMATHVQAMLDLQKLGCIVFDYGNNIRQQAFKEGVTNAFDFPGFVPAYIRPLFCEGKGPFRWAALSGNPQDIAKIDDMVLREFADNDSVVRWIKLAREKVKFQGLPARICWLGYGERAHFGEVVNRMVQKGELDAPIVIGRDHLDTGSVASPNRETEAMKDGSDAISDWPLLNALINAVGGATWVSIHHGGGVGIGYSQHAGMVIVADGTDAAYPRLQRVLTTDPGMGIIRHADAGYDEAIEAAERFGIRIPMREQ